MAEQLEGGAELLLDHPPQQGGRVGRRGDHLPAAAGGDDLVDPGPMERTLPRCHLGVGLHVIEPVLEEQLLDRRAHGLVQRDVDELADPLAAGGPDRGEGADRRDEAGDVVGLATPGVDGLVGEPGQGEDAAEGRRHEVARLPAGPGSGSPEGRERHLDQLGVQRDEVGVVDAPSGQRTGSLGLDDEVGPFGQAPVAAAAGLRRKVKVEADLGPVVPPVEQPAAGCGVLRAHGRSRPARAQLDDGRAALGEQLGREPTAVVGEIDDPKSLEWAVCHVSPLASRGSD